MLRERLDLLARLIAVVSHLRAGEVGSAVGPVRNDLTRPPARLL